MVGGDVHRFNALLGGDAQASRRGRPDHHRRACGHPRPDGAAQPGDRADGRRVAGFGFSLAMACDLLVAADDVRFVLFFTAPSAPRSTAARAGICRACLVAPGVIAALLNTPIDAREALALGLACEVVPVARTGCRRSSAGRSGGRPAAAQAGIKRLLRAAVDRDLPSALRPNARALSRVRCNQTSPRACARFAGGARHVRGFR